MTQQTNARLCRRVPLALSVLYRGRHWQSQWHTICLAMLVAVAATSAITSQAEDTKKPDSPRAMFRLLGIDDSAFDRLVDNKPIDEAENETLLRVLFRLRMFPPIDLERWAIEPEKLDSFAEHRDRRGTIFRLRGRVIEVELHKPTTNQTQRYELTEYFRCRLQLDPSGRTVEVYTEKVPLQWQKGAKPNAPAGALGVFLKLGDNAGDRAPPVFAAGRLAWYPGTPLGRLGMDVGLLDDVEDQKTSSSDTPEDREAFYQMLAAVGRAEPGQLLRQAEADLPKTRESWRWTNRQGEQEYSVVPLFNEPASQRGRLVALSGTARRIEEIRVADPDIVARFGIDHYYQISLFTDDAQGNPVTFCVRELPQGMPYGNVPRYGEAVRIAGFFFRTWSYAVPQVADPTQKPGDPKLRRQLSPLLIGRSLSWRPVAKPVASHVSSLIIAGLLLVVMAVIWLLAWQNRQRERKWLARMESPPKFDGTAAFDQSGPSDTADHATSSGRERTQGTQRE